VDEVQEAREHISSEVCELHLRILITFNRIRSTDRPLYTPHCHSMKAPRLPDCKHQLGSITRQGDTPLRTWWRDAAT
jgi:hypothetical protein